MVKLFTFLSSCDRNTKHKVIIKKYNNKLYKKAPFSLPSPLKSIYLHKVLKQGHSQQNRDGSNLKMVAIFFA